MNNQIKSLIIIGLAVFICFDCTPIEPKLLNYLVESLIYEVFIFYRNYVKE